MSIPRSPRSQGTSCCSTSSRRRTGRGRVRSSPATTWKPEAHDLPGCRRPVSHGGRPRGRARKKTPAPSSSARTGRKQGNGRQKPRKPQCAQVTLAADTYTMRVAHDGGSIAGAHRVAFAQPMSASPRLIDDAGASLGGYWALRPDPSLDPRRRLGRVIAPPPDQASRARRSPPFDRFSRTSPLARSTTRTFRFARARTIRPSGPRNRRALNLAKLDASGFWTGFARRRSDTEQHLLPDRSARRERPRGISVPAWRHAQGQQARRLLSALDHVLRNDVLAELRSTAARPRAAGVPRGPLPVLSGRNADRSAPGGRGRALPAVQLPGAGSCFRTRCAQPERAHRVPSSRSTRPPPRFGSATTRPRSSTAGSSTPAPNRSSSWTRPA